MDATQPSRKGQLDLFPFQFFPNVLTYKCPTSCAATMIPENPPVSSTIATELTFSNLLFTTHAPPTYANPRNKINKFQPLIKSSKENIGGKAVSTVHSINKC